MSYARPTHHASHGFEIFSTGSGEELLLKHANLVKKIALHLQARLPDNVQTDDLVQAGMIGLLEAVKLFDASRGASFETYAGIRIRGAILDEVRTQDWTPRSVSRNLREIGNAIRTVEIRTGNKASDREIAREMGIALERYHKISSDASSAKLLSTDELVDEDGNPYLNVASPDEQPETHTQNDSLRQFLIGAVDTLPEKERLVMALYYDKELNLKEIGAVLGVSESRVSQIHGQALARLRADVDAWQGG